MEFASTSKIVQSKEMRTVEGVCSEEQSLHLSLRPSRVRQRCTRFAEVLINNKAIIEMKQSGYENCFIYQKNTFFYFYNYTSAGCSIVMLILERSLVSITDCESANSGELF